MNETAQTLKCTEIVGQPRRNGNPLLSIGEANIHRIRAQRAGVDLESIVTPGVPIPSHFATSQGSVTLERDVDAVVYLPSRQEANATKYDMALHLDALSALCESLKNTNVRLVMSDPGTFEGADEATRMERRKAVEEIVNEFGLAGVQWRFAPADMRLARVDVNDVLEGFEMKAGGLFVHTSRGLESSSETRQAVLRRAAELIVDKHQPSEVYLPLAVGMNLHIAEICVERGIPVHFARMTEVSEWAPYNQQRVARLEQNPLVTLHGEEGYERGRIRTVVSRLANRARINQVQQVVVTDPAGSEANLLRGATNYWEAVAQLLGVNDQPAVARARANIQTWTPGMVTATAGAEEDLPF